MPYNFPMAGRIPQQFIDDLISRIDIVEVVDARVPLRKAGRDYVARCPFHDEKTPSFTVSQEKQFYHCFGCGAHGTAIGFLMEYDHMDFPEAVEDLAARVGMEVPRHKAAAGEVRQGPDLYGVLKEAAAWYRRQLREHPKGEAAVTYLKERGVSGETAAEFGLGYAPPGWDHLLPALGKAHKQALLAAGMLIEKEGGGCYDRFRDRIMFPIRDQRGRVMAFGGRVLGDDTPKYLNSPETAVFHKGRELYGLYEARQALRHLERLLVVEGYMDVIMLACHGIRYACATLGTATTTQHVERLFRLVPEVVFCFDGDRAGREAAWRALENTLPAMGEGRQARFMFLPEGEDPDSLVRQENQGGFEARIETAVTLSAFFYDNLCQRVDTSNIDGRARLVELARPYLSKLPRGVFRHMMTERLAELARLDGRALAGMLGEGPAPVGRPVRVSQRPGGKEMSLVRRAVVLLLHQPALAREAGEPGQLRGLDLPGVDLLIEMLELLQENPHFNTGTLLEHWREHRYGAHLTRLAQQEEHLKAEDMVREFADVLQRLRAQRIVQEIETLYRKPSLEEADKRRLQALLAEKKKSD
ncbi:MAG: DNA primase [Gammaproteobacteria bacterium]